LTASGALRTLEIDHHDRRVKLPAFDYAAPATLAEALALLAAAGGTAKAIAGGQSLMPVLAFRLAAPALLVDLRRVPGLDRIAIDAHGVRLGAKVRWRDIEDERRLAAAHPLLCAAVAHVAHYQIRNRGTVGGSLAHADPAAELPGIAVTCDAQIALEGPAGSRVVQASDFFLGALSTVLADDELITELRLPPWPARRRWGFEEFSRRRGDFALAGVAVYYDEDASGHASHPHIGVIGAGDRPRRLARAEATLEGRSVDEKTIAAAAAEASAEVDPRDDLHASAAYRRSLVGTMREGALRQASSRAA
jgi:carbon-monoxide dehydrogenase medium subunit